MKAKSPVVAAGCVAALYLLVAGVWILGSDQVAAWLAGGDTMRLQTVQTLKGLFFVLLMAAMLYVVVWRLMKAEARSKQMESMLAVSQKLEVVGSFAASTAHDLNNMLMVVRGMTELAKLDHRSGQTLAPERLDEIEAAVTRASELVRRLSSFVRGSEDGLVEVDAGILLRSFEPLLRQAASKEVAFEWAVEEELGSCRVHAAALEQVLLNLVVNARDALAGRDDARVRIEAETCVLRGHLSVFSGRPRTGEFVRITVIDNGPGIPPEQTVRVFEPFFTTKGPGKGSGLGLSSVMRTMQQHGGWVALQTEFGEGCRFSLHLPKVAG